jgi:uncharacterized protein (PEP-CTERM system associated)
MGTQLENLQRQLNQSSVSANGTLVNSLTGGSSFAATNALGVQGGLYRFNTFSLNSSTLLDRDAINLGLSWSTQSAIGGTSSANSTVAKTVTAQWTRSLSPDLTFSSSVSYSMQSASAVTGGSAATSFYLTAGLQYVISETLQASLRYSLFERSSGASSFSVYQNLVILGITKTF